MREVREPHTPIGHVTREKNSVSPQSHSLFSASFQTFRLTARAYLNMQKYGLFCSLLKMQSRPCNLHLPFSANYIIALHKISQNNYNDEETLGDCQLKKTEMLK